MELNERDIDWQKDAPTLVAIGKAIPFTLPAQYFEELTHTINARVLIDCQSFNQNGFRIPHNYFEESRSQIEERISVGNIKALAPTHGFTMPEGYFTELSDRINARVQESSKRDIPIRKLYTSWFSYAAAACVTVMIATGIYFSSNTENFNEQLSEVPDQEIINYLQAHSTAGDTPFIIEHLNPEELDQVTPDVSADDLELYIESTTL
ncbi:hypothetical protein [Daejeonella lutea]|uniref:Uncharacterized protein n=1 Tax=Daejeonella lutea TaxID=572036 RepID=A0A1T5A0A5_9SPHI|nr:hypothetical protein [Daejeonella lutea]SKB28285.1 hypothetical protein SAMN05661099_0155 [Daejeonella lutea]